MRYIKLRCLYIDSLLVFLLLISYILGFLEQFLIAYLAVFIHEAAHAFTANIYGCKIKKVFLLCLGTKIEVDLSLDNRIQKYFIYFAGPIINIVIACFFTISFSNIPYLLRKTTIISNTFLALFNLLPISPLDGSKILSVYTASRYGFFYSRKVSRILFAIIIFMLLLLGIPLALIWGNLSIAIITIFLLFKGLDYEEAAFLNVRNLYYRKSKFLKKGYYEVREIVVLDKLTLGETFKLMDHDRYHILIILDENLNIIHRFTETELLNAIDYHGYNSSFKDIIYS